MYNHFIREGFSKYIADNKAKMAIKNISEEKKFKDK